MITLNLKMKELYHRMFDGEITLDKSSFWLVAAVIFMMGVLYGLLKAPMTHGINIACGNNNGNHNYGSDFDENEDDLIYDGDE